LYAAAIIGCGGSADDFGSGQGNVPAEAMGRWTSSQVSDVSFGNETSSSPSGTIVQFTFLDGGRYIFEYFDMTSSYSCSTTVYGRETGTAQFSDSSFTLSPAQATLTSKSTCSTAWNYERPWNERSSFPKDYRWAWQADPILASVTDLAVVTGYGQSWSFRPHS
jgi:hypothetical protein